MRAPDRIPARTAAPALVLPAALSVLAAALSVLAACSSGSSDPTSGGGGSGGEQDAVPTAGPLPVPGSTAVTTSPEFVWSPMADVVRYELFLSLDPELPEEDPAQLTLDTSTSLFGLDAGATYYWRVDGVGAAGQRTEGAVYSFATAPTLEVGLLTASAAGTVTLGEEAPATLVTATEETPEGLRVSFGRYRCPSSPEVEVGFGEFLVEVFPADGRSPTGFVQLWLVNPDTMELDTGFESEVAVDYDGGIRYFGNGTINTPSFGDIDFEFDFALGVETSTFVVMEEVALLEGLIGPTTRLQAQVLAAEYPDIPTVLFGCGAGSLDPAETAAVGEVLREAGFSTLATADTDIALDAVDLFTAGVTRTIEPGALLRVGPWTDAAGSSATDFVPCPDAPEHEARLAFLQLTMGEEAAADFYCFAVGASPPGTTREMTTEEIETYGLAVE